MKIAISISDSLRMAPDFETSDRFLVLTILLGEIVEEEIRLTGVPDQAGQAKIPARLSDCSAVMVRNISDQYGAIFSKNNISVFKTKEVILTNAIVRYLEHQHREASNTCTCP